MKQELEQLLKANGFTPDDAHDWLINSHQRCESVMIAIVDIPNERFSIRGITTKIYSEDVCDALKDCMYFAGYYEDEDMLIKFLKAYEFLKP